MRQKRAQGQAAVANEAYFDRITQTHAGRIQVYLNTSCRPGLGQEFNIWAGIQYKEMKFPPSEECRILPGPLARVWCLANRSRRWCKDSYLEQPPYRATP